MPCCTVVLVAAQTTSNHPQVVFSPMVILRRDGIVRFGYLRGLRCLAVSDERVSELVVSEVSDEMGGGARSRGLTNLTARTGFGTFILMDGSEVTLVGDTAMGSGAKIGPVPGEIKNVCCDEEEVREEPREEPREETLFLSDVSCNLV